MPHDTPLPEPLLVARNIVQEFPASSRGDTRDVVRAVSGVSFEVGVGETLGIVGESGSGKTTLVRALMQAPRPTSGSVYFRGADLTTLRGRALLAHRRLMQMVFQDPFGSLNPAWTVSEIVEEPLVGYAIGTRHERAHKVAEVLDLVGLPVSSYGRRRPRELSGGQHQRVAIARALTVDPALLICDEAVSALDVLIQAQLLNLLEQFRTQVGLSYLFVSHDLTLVKQISDRIAVLHLGQLCEIGPTAAVYRSPLHPYTVALLAAPDAASTAMDDAELPSPLNPPPGCRFHTRCPRALDRCAREVPPLRSGGPDRLVACHSLPA